MKNILGLNYYRGVGKQNCNSRIFYLNTPTFYVLRMNFRRQIFLGSITLSRRIERMRTECVYQGVVYLGSVNSPSQVHGFPMNFQEIPDGSRGSISPCFPRGRTELTFFILGVLGVIDPRKKIDRESSSEVRKMLGCLNKKCKNCNFICQRLYSIQKMKFFALKP